MKGFLDFIKRLFGGRKKKKALSPVAVINDFIAWAAGLNLLFITGEECGVTVSRVRFAEFEGAARKAGGGYILDAFESDELPRVSIFFPAPFIEKYFSIMKKTHQERCADSDRALDLLMDWLDGRITRLFFLENGEVRSFYRMKKPWAPADEEGLMWAASGCAIIAVSDKRHSFYLLVDERTDLRLKKDIAVSDFRKAVRALIITQLDRELAVEDDESGEDIILTITKPREFVLGRFFLPVKTTADNCSLTSRFNRIIIPYHGPAYASHDFHWMKLVLNADGGSYAVYYLFRDGGNGAVARALASSAVFRDILRETMVFLKTNCRSMQLSGIQFQAGAKPADEEAAGCAILSAGVKYNYEPAQALVFVTKPFLLLLTGHLLSPWEVSLFQFTMRNRLLAIVSLNKTVFSRGIQSFVRNLGADSIPMPVEITCLPFYEFMELIGDGDLKIIIQNYLVPKYGPSYRCLFTISITERAASGDSEPAITRSRIVEVEYDRARFERFLPAALKEEDDYWRYSVSQDRFDPVNREAMEGLFRAMESDRIVLSYRARYVLVNQFFSLLQEEYAAEIERYRSAGSPFSELRDLDRNARAMAIGRVSNEDLCMAVAVAGSGEDIASAAMSDTRRGEFAEDLAGMRNRLGKEEVRPGDAAAAIRRILGAVESEKKKAQKNRGGIAGKGK